MEMEQAEDGRRKLYEHAEMSLRYAISCKRIGDVEGEKMALQHVMCLVLDLIDDVFHDEEPEEVES